MSSKDIKYQVFLSSTYEDLIQERSAVLETILRNYQFPIGMEMFNADDKNSWEIIKNTIDTSDIYILLIGHRYGSTTKGARKISYTQKEFEYALRRKREGKLKILAFIRKEESTILPAQMERSAHGKKMLFKFRETVKKSNVLVKFWATKDDLCQEIAYALPNLIENYQNSDNLNGWIKRTSIKHEKFYSENLQELKRFMKKMSKDFISINEEIETYYIDKHGNCTLERNRTQVCMSNQTHNYTEWIADEDTHNSKIIKVTDIAGCKNLNIMVDVHDKDIFSLFVLFDQVIPKGKTIKYRVKVFLENYVSNLINSGHGVIGFSSFKQTSFTSKSDIFIFPQIPLYKNLKVTMVKKQLGKNETTSIPRRIMKDNRYSYKVNYGTINYGTEVEVHFSI